MTRMQGWAAGTSVFVLGSIAICQQPATAQPKPCADPARQKIAVNLARRINTLQVNQFGRTHIYQPMTAFPELSVPPGFTTQLVTNAAGSEYLFSVKDTQNPCGAAIFSDQDGLIYIASPLQ